MLAWKYIFFLSIFIVIYNYFGYAIIAGLINLVYPKYRGKNTGNYYPSVSFIIAAYNEALIIEKKIENTLNLNYPKNKIEYIIITDGSTDDTPEIVNRFGNVRLLHLPERKGKSSALNRAVKIARNDVLIISDANTFLNSDAVINISKHYRNPQAGGVAGEKKVVKTGLQNDEIGEREGLYWKYESLLKQIDSDFYSVVGAAGELFSVRRSLYEDIPESTILDDFVISLKIAAKGYRIIYEPNAYAMEFASVNLREEKKRKVRIAAGGFQAISFLLPLLKFWKHPKLTFLYLSHRVLRWTLSPICLILILVSNIFLAAYTNTNFYKISLLLQVIFYSLSFISTYISNNSTFKHLKIFGYFVFMNISVIQGFFRFITKSQTTNWEKAKRTSDVIIIK